MISEMEAEQRELDKQLQYLPQSLEEKENELNQVKDSLNDMKTSQRETRNRSQVLSRLKDAQRDGILNGTYSRLGDLGTIDSKYDCAITSSCGYLDHIVDDTVENGQKCISYLREHRIGLGKFICLDIVSKNNRHKRSKSFKPPEGS